MCHVVELLHQVHHRLLVFQAEVRAMNDSIEQRRVLCDWSFLGRGHIAIGLEAPRLTHQLAVALVGQTVALLA